jgi:hypothetical protein
MPEVEVLRLRHKPLNDIAERFISCVTHSESRIWLQRRLHEQDAIARWFDVDHEEKKLRIYNRFSQLCDPGGTGNSNNANQYPVIVSFIGNTMAGKSSLIRAMISLSRMNMLSEHPVEPQDADTRISQLENSTNWGPVTRSANLQDLTKPTTRGVHLYRGENTPCASNNGRERLILFADCEGFEGGNQQTNSETYGAWSRARSRVRSRSPLPPPSSSDDGNEPDSEYCLEPASELPLKAASYSTQGKSGVELFYARFLYAMSNIVVYVVDRDTSLQKSLTQLFGWAASAVFKSINNPSRKTLIIVRHKADRHDTSLYDETFMKDTFLDQLDTLWAGEPELRALVDRYNSQQTIAERRIWTNDHLFKLFFDDIKCCYIPGIDKVKKKPEELFQQYCQLGKQIAHAAHKAQHGATQSWTSYNVPMLNRVLKSAFDHFRESDDPFDFCKAARNENSQPQSPADHFANFLRHLFACEANIDPRALGQLMSDAFVICLIIREIRLRKICKISLSLFEC